MMMSKYLKTCLDDGDGHKDVAGQATYNKASEKMIEFRGIKSIDGIMQIKDTMKHGEFLGKPS